MAMDKIYSEADVTDSGLSWGEWKFSLSEDKVHERISSFAPGTNIFDAEEERWAHLFSVLKNSTNVNQSILEVSMANAATEETPMEHSMIGDTHHIENMNETCQIDVQDYSSFIVDICNRLVPKLRSDTPAIQTESESVSSHLSKFSKETLIAVMKNAWSQLQTDESKFCFCVVFSLTIPMCHCLCEHILLPWLRVNHSTKLELLSSILAKEGDTVCVNLIAPLLQAEDSPWVRDIPSVEELMSAMTVQNWTVLLKELLSDLKELQEWQIPVLSAVVQHAEPSYQELHLLVQLMSSASSTFAQNRDFGALVAAVASSLKSDSAALGHQLKVIVNNFKGSLKVMKFKTLKIIADITD